MERLEKTVCIIEDNPAIVKLFAILFKKSGYETIGFTEGLPAIEWLRNNNPMLVICDDSLPDTSGTEIIKLLRTFPHGKSMPAIAVTGFANEGDRNRYISIGFSGYIPKPIETASFVKEALEVVKQ